MEFVINTDGGARGNPGPAACAAVIKNTETNQVFEISKYLSVATNNVAEYSGVILAFIWLQEKNVIPEDTTLKFYLDSLLVVSQLKGEYKIKNENIKVLASKVKEFEKSYQKVEYFHVPRAQNSDADKLVNECLDKSLHA